MVKSLNTNDSLRIFGISVLAMLIAGYVAVVLTSESNPDISFYLTTLFSQIGIAAAVYSYCKISKINFFNQTNLSGKPQLKHMLISIVIALATLAVMLPIQLHFIDFITSLGYQGTDSYFPVANGNIEALIALIFTTALVPAFCEEILFRGAILKGLYNSHNTTIAVVISGLLFMFMHGNIAQILHPFAMGIIIAIVVIKTNSLWCGILMHFINNLSVTLCDEYFPQLYDFAYNNSIWFIIIGAVILGGMLTLIFTTSSGSLQRNCTTAEPAEGLSEVQVIINKSKSFTSLLITILLVIGAGVILVTSLIISW